MSCDFYINQRVWILVYSDDLKYDVVEGIITEIQHEMIRTNHYCRSPWAVYDSKDEADLAAISLNLYNAL